MSPTTQLAKASTTHYLPVLRGLLMLAYWYPPVNESGALRPFRFCKFLPEFGYEPFVVAASNAGPHCESQNVLRTPGAHRKDHATWWLGAIVRSLQRILPYNDCLEWVPHAVKSAQRLLCNNEISVIVSTSPPVATHLVALWLKMRFKVVWIADFRDPLVGNPFRTRLHGRPYDVFLERLFLFLADAIVINTDAAFSSLAQRHPKHQHKLHLIWNGYDPEDDIKASEVQSDGRKIIGHFGAVYGGRHPGRLIDSLERLLVQKVLQPESICLSLIGSMEAPKTWLSRCAFQELVHRGCLEFTDKSLPRAVARKKMQEVDFLLLLDLNELGTGLQVPAKVFEYVRVGRPILAFTSKRSPVDRILQQCGIPHICIYQEDSEKEIDSKVRALLAMPTKPTRPSDWFYQNFDARKQTKALARLVDSTILAR